MTNKIVAEKIEQALNKLNPDARRAAVKALREEFSEFYWFTIQQDLVKIEAR